MHNKFLAVDNMTVLTGSANFTRAAFDPKAQYFNYENVIIFNSADFAQKYNQEFFNIEKDIFKIYIKEISSKYPMYIPKWITKLAKKHYQKNPRFAKILNETLKTLDPIQQQQLQVFFKLQPKRLQIPARPQEPVTSRQKMFLENRGISTEGMSKQAAIKLIGEIKRQEEEKERISLYKRKWKR